jgi:hypothetical protein
VNTEQDLMQMVSSIKINDQLSDVNQENVDNEEIEEEEEESFTCN